MEEDKKMAKYSQLENLSISASNYVCCVGFEELEKAQEEIAGRTGESLKPEQRLKVAKDKMISKVLIETFFVHFLFGFLSGGGAAYVSWSRHLRRGNVVRAWLAAGTIWSKFVIMSASAQTSFSLRLSQVFSRFEIRRLQCDIRTCDMELIHKIAPRYKSLLRECHIVGNIGHKYFWFFIPIIAVSALQVVGGIYLSYQANSNRDKVEVHMTVQDDYSDDTGERVYYVPVWVFAHALQPTVSVLFFIYNYALLNLAIERDIRQDLVELSVRLTYTEEMLHLWLVEQLRCLQELDGRAFTLPMLIIPNLDMARMLARVVVSAFVLIMPYLIAMKDFMTAELL